jgi:hypothetical protein
VAQRLARSAVAAGPEPAGAAAPERTPAGTVVALGGGPAGEMRRNRQASGLARRAIKSLTFLSEIRQSIPPKTSDASPLRTFYDGPPFALSDA